MLTSKEKEMVANFDDAMNHLQRQGAPEYRRFRENCLRIAPLLVSRMSVREGTVATAEWKMHYQKELKQQLEYALQLLNRIEVGNYDKRTS